jgi:TonB family protein
MKSFLLSSALAGLLVASIASAAPAEPTTFSARIFRNVDVTYPLSLLRDGVSHGEARVLININDKGVIIDTLPLAYTHKPFLTATLDALKKWKYEPGRIDNVPVNTLCEITVRFEVSGILVFDRTPVNMPHQDIAGEEYVYRVHGVRTLDRIPTPLHITQPVYPKDWIAQGLRGKVTVDFYVDETGAIRMPSVGASDHPLLAASVVQAVSEWRFTPPTRRGQPVLVRCQQVFNFTPPSETPAPASP